VEVGPKEKAAGAVVWLHGLGASGSDFEDVVPLLRLPEVRFVFPHAPVHAVTINGGLLMPAWYDILHLGGGGERAEHVRESVQHVEALLARERERGVSASRTVLAGFSQGGAIALFAGVRYAQTLTGIMVLSGYEVLPETLEAEAGDANRMTPVLFCHGIYDPMVPIERAREAYRRCAESGRPAEWHEFPMEHQVSMEEIEVIREWLHARFAAE
jgi:phospholipase/carboxylesterase